MDEFLERYNCLRLNKKEIANMNKPIISNKIESIILKLPTSKSPGPHNFTSEFCHTCKEELRSIVLKLFQKLLRKE